MNTLYRRGLAALAAGAALAGLLAACGADTPAAGENTASQTASEAFEATTPDTGTQAASGGTFTWSEAEATVITLSGDNARVEGRGAEASGSTVTINSAGTYLLRGTLVNGQILVDAGKDDTVRLVLDGVDITCDDSAAIYSASSGETVVILADGSENTLTDGASYTYASAEDDEPDAALFVKDNLTIGGEGALVVTASYNNGIGAKDDLVIAGGSITVTAPNHAIRGRDSLTVTGGSLQLTAGNDGLQSNNDGGEDVGWIRIEGGDIQIHAAHDAIQAESALTITGGSLALTTANGHDEAPVNASAEDTSDSYKALKAGGDISITGGTFTIDAADDAVHGNGDVTIEGGTFTISTGDDGVHADGDLLITGGTIDILASYEGLEGSTVIIRDGEIALVASDDGINAAGGSDVSEDYVIRFEGGSVEIDAAGDGFDSNGSVYMSGGTVVVHGPTSGGDGAVDYEIEFGMTGGTLVAAGSSGMAMAPTADASTQPSLMVFFTQSQNAGETVGLKDGSGETVVSYTSKKTFSSIVISSPRLASGETYTLYVGGSETGTLSLDSMLTSVDETGAAASGGMMGGFGGFGRGMGGGPGGRGGEEGGMAPPGWEDMPDMDDFPDGMPDMDSLPDFDSMPDMGEPPEGLPNGDEIPGRGEGEGTSPENASGEP